jgi:DNA gyrase/topoisomerase IV subunit A
LEINLLALVGASRGCSAQTALKIFIDHRYQIITRRTRVRTG